MRSAKSSGMAALVCNILSSILSVLLVIAVGITMLVLGLTDSLQDDEECQSTYQNYYCCHGCSDYARARRVTVCCMHTLYEYLFSRIHGPLFCIIERRQEISLCPMIFPVSGSECNDSRKRPPPLFWGTTGPIPLVFILGPQIPRKLAI